MNKTQQLLSDIKQYNEAYRKGAPLISDLEYDQKIEELRQLDPQNAWFNKIEPAPVPENRKVKLPIPMKSLNKVKDMKSIQNWIESIGLTDEDIIVATPKFDGLSLLHDEYSGMAFSRGGSENEGQDCSSHYAAAQFAKRLSNLKYTFGEFVFRKKKWEDYFANRISPYTGDKYKSPRNTAAGLLNRDQPSEELKYVDFFRYGTDAESLKQFTSYIELYTYLCRTFGQPFLYDVIRVKDLDEQTLITDFEKFNEEYYIDGVVLYANDLSIWEKVGRKNSGNPNYAIAYKNPAFTATFKTTVKSVTWRISKSGALKPVVNIDTVDTGDCEMENPTGYNANYIAENKIATGATLRVTRSGGVIPKILEVLSPAPEHKIESMWDKLSTCPDCGCPLSWNDSHIELCCTNKQCKGIRLAKIIFFYTTLGAEYMGEETITKIFNSGYDTLKKILNITFEELVDIDGFGEGIANAVLNNNKKIKEGVEVTLLMHASDCFEGIGQIKAKKILENMPKEITNSFINGYLNISPDIRLPKFIKKSLTKTDQAFEAGIMPFYQFVAENELKILPMQEKASPTNDRYKDMNICFTGIRDKNLEEEIVNGGGSICSGVSKKTTHLIVADLNSVSSKMNKAESLNIPIILYQDFKDKY